MTEPPVVRRASAGDLDAVRRIYNEGIEDRMATLDAALKSRDDIAQWWAQHHGFPVLVALDAGAVVGWASLNRFSHRCAHADVADLSVYVARSHRGHGVGFALLRALDAEAIRAGFHKIVLHAVNENEAGKALYRKSGFNEVGVFAQHGLLDGRRVDVIAMEKILG
jgi:L-amino acid N-acyltransferase YncA